MKRKITKWEIAIYIIAICTLVVTAIAILLDRESITEYYEMKQAAIIEQREEKALLQSFFDGEGTEDEPYLIENVNDLNSLRTVIGEGVDCEDLYFAQIDNIDLTTEREWSPISPSVGTAYFAGTYDGRGHLITNLLLNLPNTSFFGKVSGTILNLGFEGVTFESDDCATIVNQVTDDRNLWIVNCFVNNISNGSNFENVGALANNFSRGTALHCWSYAPIYFITEAQSSRATLYDCTVTHIFADNEKAPALYMENSGVYITSDIRNVVNKMNNGLPWLAVYGFVGELNHLEVVNDQNVQYTSQTTYVQDESDVNVLYKFVRNVGIYIVLFILTTIACCFISKKKQWDLAKTVFYSLLTLCTVMTLGYGIMTRGASIIAMLYDGRSEGQLKMFTDFFDCIRPGFNAYTQNDSGITTIYPPLISVAFALLRFFVPDGELHSSIVARNSQMGMVVFAYIIGITTILLYKTIHQYKKGSKYEIRAFLILLAFSFPILDTLERGNVSIFCGLLMAVFLYNYRSDNKKQRIIAYIALSVAAGIKIYPALLGILLIREKKMKEVFNCMALGVVINLVPSAFLSTGFSSIAYMVINARTMISNNAVIGGKIDLAHLIQIPEKISHLPILEFISAHYMILCAILILLIIVIIFYSKMEDWKIYSLVILGIIMLSSFSPHYYYIYLLAPLMMFLDLRGNRKKRDILYAVLFVGVFMTFASLNKYPLAGIIPGERVWNMTIVSGTMSVLFMLALLIEGICSCTNRLLSNRRKKHV